MSEEPPELVAYEVGPPDGALNLYGVGCLLLVIIGAAALIAHGLVVYGWVHAKSADDTNQPTFRQCVEHCEEKRDGE